jgi:hypothetical protein
LVAAAAGNLLEYYLQTGQTLYSQVLHPLVVVTAEVGQEPIYLYQIQAVRVAVAGLTMLTGQQTQVRLVQAVKVMQAALEVQVHTLFVVELLTIQEVAAAAVLVP